MKPEGSESSRSLRPDDLRPISRPVPRLEDELRTIERCYCHDDIDGVIRAVAQLPNALRELSESMREQFTLEEEGQFFDELFAVLPAEARRIDGLRSEHRILLARVDEIIVRFVGNWDEALGRLRADVDELVRAVRRHERSESDLLTRGNCTEIGAGE